MKQMIPLFLLLLMFGACNSESEKETVQATENSVVEDSSTLVKNDKKMKVSPVLAKSIEKAIGLQDQISEERKAQLDELASYIKTQQEKGEPVHLKFICTHNSRRSQLAEIWAATAAAYHGISPMKTSSGGTEATAFNPRAVAALERAGFQIDQEKAEDNPHYSVYIGEQEQEAYSKTYKEGDQSPFMAVMVCSDADKKCPLVPGAQARLAIPYVDPKVSDGTPEEAVTYDERSFQIASELFYVMERVVNLKM